MKKYTRTKKDCNTVQTRLSDLVKTQEVQAWLDRKAKQARKKAGMKEQ